MFIEFEHRKRLAPIFGWGFLAYGPVGLFIGERYGYKLRAENYVCFYFIMIPAMLSGLCALVAAVVYLFRGSWRAVLLAAFFALEFSMVFTPFGDVWMAEGFADFIQPEAAYVQKHCAPINFVQDGKTYQFGVCDLTIDDTGQIDNFTFVYDSSGDIGDYDHLSGQQRAIFVNAVRTFFNDDPNDGFEHANFTAIRYYNNFYDVSFDDTDGTGFYPIFGKPPENKKNPYSHMFW